MSKAKRLSLSDVSTADRLSATRRPRRYLLVGLVCAGVHNGVMFGCDSLGVQYLIALLVSFAVLAPTGYTLHSLFTFERSMEPRRFLRFTAGMLGGFPINTALMIALISGMGFKVPLATLVCTGLMFVWNYCAARWAILRGPPANIPANG